MLACSYFQCKKESELDTNKNITIIVQPFANFPKSRVTTVVKEIRKIYKNCKVNPAISFPQDSWNAEKSRRRADKLIKYLNNLAETDQLYIGLTSEDISTTKNQYKDWGVFGLGYRPGKSCIASTFRLKGNKDVKLFKVAIHELGHTQGLSHCPIASCFMRNAKGKDVLDFETEFCSSCKAVLLQKGW
ncbi:matrixin family metalloprotease [Flavobacterium sp.]|uniref:matrixin family metalloprotease n=1 Tax=Flavobacterium sp. TaxID=239 RepID=UPI003D12DC8D